MRIELCNCGKNQIDIRFQKKIWYTNGEKHQKKDSEALYPIESLAKDSCVSGMAAGYAGRLSNQSAKG